MPAYPFLDEYDKSSGTYKEAAEVAGASTAAQDIPTYPQPSPFRIGPTSPGGPVPAPTLEQAEEVAPNAGPEGEKKD